jgi:transcriptional regulator with XRE-family HTH domain
MNLNQKMHFLRKNILKITQDEFAKKLNLSRGHIANIETCRTILTDRLLNEICEKYNINKNWFHNDNAPIFIEEDKEIKYFIEQYNKLDDMDKKYIEKILDSFLQSKK